jgi:hypothetical protein
VEDADAAWIAARAPTLRGAQENEDTTHDDLEGARDVPLSVETVSIDIPISDDVPRSNFRSSSIESSNMMWWTRISSDSKFEGVPPWDSRAQHRLIRCDLPHGVELTIDPITGLVRATDTTNHFDKRISYWVRIRIASNDDEGTRGLAYALAEELQTTTKSLVYCVVNAPPRTSTWIHIQMIVNPSCWCSPAYSVHVSKLVTRYHSGQLTTEQSIEAVAAVNASMRPADEDDNAPMAIVGVCSWIFV